MKDEIVIVSVGDTMLGDRALSTLRREGWDYPFRRVRQLTDRGDLLVGNLEAPITRGKELFIPNKRWSYKQAPRSAEVYAQIGFDAFSLANNHVMDYGPGGLFDTIRSLHSVGIRSFGAGKDARHAGEEIIVNLRGVRIALVGWMQTYRNLKQARGYATSDRPGVARWNGSEVRASCARLREKCDVLIASIHWGRNYRPVTDDQMVMGRQLIDWGADGVNGHHPHIAHRIEIYKGKPILYSLGNFVFGAPGRFAKKGVTGYGLVAAYVIEDNRLSRVELDLIAVDNESVKYQPTPVQKEEARLVLGDLMASFGSMLCWENARAFISLAEPGSKVANPCRRPVALASPTKAGQGPKD